MSELSTRVTGVDEVANEEHLSSIENNHQQKQDIKPLPIQEEKGTPQEQLSHENSPDQIGHAPFPEASSEIDYLAEDCPPSCKATDHSQYVKQEGGKLEKDVACLKHLEIKKQQSSDKDLTEQISPCVIYANHICQGKAFIPVFPCTAIISGIKKRGKTAAFKSFLSQTIRTINAKETSFFGNHSDEQCLSCFKAILLGVYPLDDLTWLMSKTESDNAVMCLMSYFARLCKNRDLSPRTDYYRLLEFAPVPATSESINISSPEVANQLKQLYVEFKEHWDRLKDNEDLQSVMPTGVCLLNMFDVGPCEAAQDMLPFINKYCKRMINIVCYDSTKDTDTLKKEFSGETQTNHYRSTKYQLMRQLCGVNKENIVVLTAINDAEGDAKQEAELAKALEQAVGVDKVHHLRISPATMKESKAMLENIVKQASFYTNIPIHNLLLLHIVRKKSNTFWMKRSEIESLAHLYGFKNGDLENCLRLLASFGSILYTHDIPTLREYVIIDIVGFVKCIHKIYHSPEATASYGLFKSRDNADSKIIFEFLTTFSIATEVKSNQLIDIEVELPSLEMFTTYYYIPTARTAVETHRHTPSFHNTFSDKRALRLLLLDGYTKENLHVCLCRCLLETKECLLIPTKPINTSVIRFSTNDNTEQDIEFIDDGNSIMVQLLSNEHVISEERKDELLHKLVSRCSFFKSNTTMERQGVIATLQQHHDPQKMIQLATELSKLSLEKKASLSKKLGFEQEWLQNRTATSEQELILWMLSKFEANNTTKALINILNGLDIQIS